MTPVMPASCILIFVVFLYRRRVFRVEAPKQVPRNAFEPAAFQELPVKMGRQTYPPRTRQPVVIAQARCFGNGSTEFFLSGAGRCHRRGNVFELCFEGWVALGVGLLLNS